MIKYRFLTSLILLGLIACKSPSSDKALQSSNLANDSLANSGIGYGEKIDGKGAIQMDSLLALVAAGKTSLTNIKVEGQIEAVCQAKGCWMDIASSDSTKMHVSFNEEFFIPLNSAGKKTIFMGDAYMDTTSVEALQHFAEDDGQSKAEIAKIVSPEIRLIFDAKGVIIK